MNNTQKPIYLDYHATTPVDPKILKAVLPFYTEHFGNPASRSHPYGWKASEAVEMARVHVADLIHVEKSEIFFTSGATEGLNMLIKGLAENLSYKGKHIITVTTEHQAVLDPLNWLSTKGFEILKLPVDPKGIIDHQKLIDSFRKDTIMVMAMWANNETGVIHDVKAIGDICDKKGVAFICDATQAAGKIEVDAVQNNIDALVLSAHKMYGPKGSGAVYISKNKKKIKPEALIYGGGHEMGYRSGTLNVPGIVGLGVAADLCKSLQQNDQQKIGALRDEFENRIISSLEAVEINGDVANRLPTVSNLKILYVDSQAIMTKLRTRLAISSGSACSSADPSPSHVLMAMGLTPEEAKGSLRISLGRPTTKEELDKAGQWLIDEIKEYRSQSPVWQMFKQGVDMTGRFI
ncbi:MAG TPA: cysteine desulfurase family protein [Saprospiraceae bacterium]|nr:cysteine desulfurase family protein [Saprospiraceae bacterium]